MNDYIAMILMSRLLHLDYVEKFGGIVQTIQRTTQNSNGESIVIKIPVAKAFHQFKDDEKGIDEKRIEILRCGLTSKILEDFVPESKLSGMVYFEDNGCSPDLNKRHSSLRFWNSKIRLVGWFNQKKIRNNFDNQFRSTAMIEMLQALSMKRPKTAGVLKNLYVTADNVPSLDSLIFSEYDYKESDTQFLTAPYDFFAIDLNISFGIAKNCIIKFVTEEILCK